MHVYPKGAGISLSLISSHSFFTTHLCHSMVPHFTDGELEAEAKGTGRLGGEWLEQTWGGGSRGCAHFGHGFPQHTHP